MSFQPAHKTLIVDSDAGRSVDTIDTFVVLEFDCILLKISILLAKDSSTVSLADNFGMCMSM